MKQRQVEVLAPAGSFESMKAAIAAGADAVYIGGSQFGARAYADNLDEDHMLEAINYAHLHGASLYMTVNTLVKEKELDIALAIEKVGHPLIQSAPLFRDQIYIMVSQNLLNRYYGDRAADLVRLDILLNGEPVDALAVIVHRDRAYAYGRALALKLKRSIPRQTEPSVIVD